VWTYIQGRHTSKEEHDTSALPLAPTRSVQGFCLELRQATQGWRKCSLPSLALTDHHLVIRSHIITFSNSESHHLRSTDPQLGARSTGHDHLVNDKLRLARVRRLGIICGGTPSPSYNVTHGQPPGARHRPARTPTEHLIHVVVALTPFRGPTSDYLQHARGRASMWLLYSSPTGEAPRPAFPR
jgi:hypothetical protein